MMYRLPLKYALALILAADSLYGEPTEKKGPKVEAGEENIKDRVAFGRDNSFTEVFIFTDWKCPSCHNVEPTFTALVADIKDQARIIFADIALQPESHEFTPFNISFMLYNKEKYFRLRHLLTELASNNTPLAETDLIARAKTLGVEYKHPSVSDVTSAVHYFNRLAQQFKVPGAPAVVIANSKTKKMILYLGEDEINGENMIKAIELLNQE